MVMWSDMPTSATITEIVDEKLVRPKWNNGGMNIQHIKNMFITKEELLKNERKKKKFKNQ